MKRLGDVLVWFKLLKGFLSNFQKKSHGLAIAAGSLKTWFYLFNLNYLFFSQPPPPGVNGSGHVAVVSPLKSVSPFATYQPSLSHPTQAKGSLSLPLNKADLNWSAQPQGTGAGKLNEMLLLSLIW